MLAVDRAEYDAGATIYFSFWKQKKGTDTLPQSPDGDWALIVQVVPGNGGPARQLQIAATQPKVSTNPKTPDPRYAIAGLKTYAIPLPALREPGDPKNPTAEVPALLGAGDRLQITITNDTDPPLMVDVGIVSESVLPAPTATYGLATLQGQAAVGTALFATAPLPQAIEFPDLVNDLVAGHVRRRELFLWPFAANRAPATDEKFAFLVKVDRTGGGQLPSSKSDFQSCE